MIVSHQHRFIFLKTRKTAGTSVEIALSRYCGPSDIVTPISPSDERIRHQTGGTPPQNVEFPLHTYLPRDWAVLVLKRRRRLAFNHMAARDVRRMVGRRVWDSYYKFTIVRNPWDAVISNYFWQYRDREAERPPLRDFIESKRLNSLLRDVQTYSINGKMVVDQVCRYENLMSDLETARIAIGLPTPLELPHAKGGIRGGATHYREFLSVADAELIRSKFAAEIGLLGYRY